jgi:hypothetical protein
MAATEPYVRNQLYLIPLSELLPDPNQPRKFLDPLALDKSGVIEAVESMRQNIDDFFTRVAQ